MIEAAKAISFVEGNVMIGEDGTGVCHLDKPCMGVLGVTKGDTLARGGSTSQVAQVCTVR
jgi:hypothetical protein